MAFVLDENDAFQDLYNTEMVDLEPVESEENVDRLRSTIERHRDLTGSGIAKRNLENRSEYLPKFVKVMPNDLTRALRKRQESEPEVVR